MQMTGLITASVPYNAVESSHLESLVKLSLKKVSIFMLVKELHQAHGSAVVS